MTAPIPPPFNLLDEPWIPLEDLTGHVAHVGLAAAFELATEKRRIVDSSPLVTIALYRLLFAIFHRAFPVSRHEAWVDAWEANEAHRHVGAYLERWRHRFNLFDADAPFWQVPDLDASHGTMAWTKLAAELNDNNTKVLFDHTATLTAAPTTAAQAARALVACQVMSVGAGNSAVGYNVNSPVATALVVVPEGQTLADTLLANTRVARDEADSPVWEREPPSASSIHAANEAKPAVERPFAGVADRLTWRTRALRLVPPEDGDQVLSVHFGAGERAATVDGERDPWVPYRVTKDGAWIPRRWNTERAVWRDLQAIVMSTPGESDAPRILADLGILSELADRSVPDWTLLVAGQAADKAKVMAWGQERWRIPVRLIEGSSGVQNALREAMARAERTAGELRSCAWRVARDALGGGDPDQGDVRAAMDRLPTLTTYWSVLEPAFSKLLSDLGRMGFADPIPAAHARWFGALSQAVERAALDTHRVLGRDAVAIRAWARTGPRFATMARSLEREAERLQGGMA